MLIEISRDFGSLISVAVVRADSLICTWIESEIDKEHMGIVLINKSSVFLRPELASNITPILSTKDRPLETSKQTTTYQTINMTNATRERKQMPYFVETAQPIINLVANLHFSDLFFFFFFFNTACCKSKWTQYYKVIKTNLHRFLQSRNKGKEPHWRRRTNWKVYIVWNFNEKSDKFWQGATGYKGPMQNSI